MAKWKDNVMSGVEYVGTLLDFMMKERSQLYGTIIYLMILNKLTKAELPPFEVMKRYGTDYYIMYEGNESGGVDIKLMEQEHDEETLLD